MSGTQLTFSELGQQMSKASVSPPWMG